MYLQFLNECTEETENNNLHCTILYTKFSGWFKKNDTNIKIPSYKEFMANIKKHKEIVKTKINGIAQSGIKNIKIV